MLGKAVLGFDLAMMFIGWMGRAYCTHCNSTLTYAYTHANPAKIIAALKRGHQMLHSIQLSSAANP
jgi:hypothetical protein